MQFELASNSLGQYRQYRGKLLTLRPDYRQMPPPSVGGAVGTEPRAMCCLASTLPVKLDPEPPSRTAFR